MGGDSAHRVLSPPIYFSFLFLLDD